MTDVATACDADTASTNQLPPAKHDDFPAMTKGRNRELYLADGKSYTFTANH